MGLDTRAWQNYTKRGGGGGGGGAHSPANI